MNSISPAAEYISFSNISAKVGIIKENKKKIKKILVIFSLIRTFVAQKKIETNGLHFTYRN